MKNINIYNIMLSILFIFVISTSLSANSNNCTLEILNSSEHCNSVDFSLLVNYQGTAPPDFSLELYIDNEFVDYITSSPWNWNDTEAYFNNLEAGDHFIDIIGYSNGFPVCSTGKAITLLNDCSVPNSNTMWCNISFSDNNFSNSFCENYDLAIYTEVSAFTDEISLYLDNEFVGTQTVPQAIYSNSNEKMKLIWDAETYPILDNLSLGEHLLNLYTLNSTNSFECSSEIDFFIEECESSSNGIELSTDSKYTLKAKVFLGAFYD